MISELIDSVLKIHFMNYEKNIYPWIQNDLYTPYWRFYWNPVCGGCLRLRGEVIRMTPEHVYVIPGYLIFDTFAEEPFTQFYIHFNPSERTRPQNQIFELPAEGILNDSIRSCITLENTDENKQLKMLAALSFLSSALIRLPADLFLRPRQIDPRIEKLCNYLQANRNRPISNTEMADQIKLERNSFIRLFTAEMHESPQVYFRKKRIELACELLHFSKLSIEEIAAATGFADRYHFTRLFTQVLRITPAAFRRKSG